MHPGDDRFGRIFCADRRGDRVHPAPKLVAVAAERVAFVAEVPCRDGGMIAHFPYEMAHETDLPLDALGIGDGVFVFQCRRQESAAAHPARDQPDHKLHVVALRGVAHETEAFHHLFIDAGRVGEGHVALQHAFGKRRDIADHARERLEVGPQRENPKRVDALRAERGEVFFDRFRIPAAPHVGSGVRCPVVDTGEEPS